jgi:CRP-like cAMP-binding protein
MIGHRPRLRVARPCPPDTDWLRMTCTMKNPRFALLRNIAIFASVSEQALEIIHSDTREVSVGPGDYFFQQGAHGKFMYVLMSGHVQVHIKWRDQDVPISRIGPGGCFGEIALISHAPRSASVQAETHCTAIAISNRDIYKLKRLDLEQYVIVQENISLELCERLRVADVNRMMMAESRSALVDIELPWP